MATKTEVDPFLIGRSELESTTVKITQILHDPVTKASGKYDKELPFKIRIEDKEGVVFDDSTTKIAYTKDWNKKFYVNQQGFVAFSRDDIILAILKIIEKDPEKSSILAKLDDKSFHAKNNLLNYKFEAILTGAPGAKWINWINTFILHGIPVPTVEELRVLKGGEKTTGEFIDGLPQKDNSKVVDKALDVPQSGLPF